MKYIKYILLLILIIPINAYAYDIICPSGPYEYEDTFECYITGDNNITYDELSGYLELPKSSVFTCDFDDPENGFTKNDVSKGFKYTGKSESNELVKISCKVSSKPSQSGVEQLIIPNFKYHELDSNKDAFTEILRSNNIQYKGYVEQAKAVTKPRGTDNPDTRLKNISEPNLDFVFSSFKTEYEVSVKFEIDKLDLLIVPNNEAATVEIDGSQDLTIGPNIIDIYVTSPDGTSKTCYTLTVNRLKRGEEIYYIEKDSSLSGLSIDGYNINFESIIYEYKIHLKWDVDNINIKAVATNPASTINISNTDDLKNGDAVNVTVTSQDGSTTTTYTIKITKDAKPKDYRSTIYISVFAVTIGIVIFIILRTNIKNKGNPLLKIKAKKQQLAEKAEQNKKLDMNSVPNAESSNVITPVANPPVENVEVLNNSAPTQPVVESTPVVPVQPQVAEQPVVPAAPAEPQVVQPEPVVATPQVPVEPVAPVQPVAPVEPVQPVQPQPAETNIFDQ